MSRRHLSLTPAQTKALREILDDAFQSSPTVRATRAAMGLDKQQRRALAKLRRTLDAFHTADAIRAAAHILPSSSQVPR